MAPAPAADAAARAVGAGTGPAAGAGTEPAPGIGRAQPRWLVQPLGADGTPYRADGGSPTVMTAAQLAAADAGRPRWVLDGADRHYPALLRAGVRLTRCHDIVMTERLLQGRVGEFGVPVAAAAVVARATGAPVPADPGAQPAADAVPALFDTPAAGPQPERPDAVLDRLGAALRDQLGRLSRQPQPAPLRLLVAADSTSALAAVELSAAGMPWDADEHDRLLSALLGPRPRHGGRPAKLQALADQVAAALGGRVNPDSPTDLRQAFYRNGIELTSTRSWVLKSIEHPAIAPLLAYKELARLYTANGWNWLSTWVVEGRLHTEFVPAGVVSGRWATRGGGGLQLPRALRAAGRARSGWTLVVADAAQLEPRVLAAVSADPALQQICRQDDLYVALAADGFGGDRAAAKLAMLGAMYGQTSGEAGRLLATLRARYPASMALLQRAADTGEAGGVVHSVLGRASPPPSEAWRTVTAADTPRAREQARSWGRFTRNFVVQASAADWAAVWLSLLRAELLAGAAPGAELVFFQHDELILHCPSEQAQTVCELARSTADAARALVFPRSTAATPVRPVAVGCYADAK
ncbi:bifunctional 3'-5' exonuclease/DNA polymerase [Nakamurella aerolata]|uniref:bifunctional 3'-5' exonuclease/DNA polymerase n=1 Tax=Nakamurella aerolata TaxID=1656892 RepID=UPI003CCE3C99